MAPLTWQTLESRRAGLAGRHFRQWGICPQTATAMVSVAGTATVAEPEPARRQWFLELVWQTERSHPQITSQNWGVRGLRPWLPGTGSGPFR
jgi:hypothetical protein